MFGYTRKNYKINIVGIGEITVKEYSTSKGMRIIVHRDKSVTVTLRPGITPKKVESYILQNAQWIASVQKRCSLIEENKLNKNQTITEKDIETLSQSAKKYLPSRVETIANSLGINYNKVKINRAKTRWGSCSFKKNINLSCYLMQLPMHLIDFVIMHELCHTVYFNHGQQFHKLLNQICKGQEKELNKQLKKYRIR